MLSVKSNMLAQNANRQLNVNTKKSAKNVEKLSSGYKINRAADDAAGLGVSEKMRRQIRGLHQGAENIQDGVGYVQTADGALNESQEILQRINELSVKAANGTNTEEDRFYINQEIQQLKTELARIFDTTTYNERKIWESNDRKVIGYDRAQAVEFRSTYDSIDITDANRDVIAEEYYQIHADRENGVYVTWTGYDGLDYETEPISWEDFKKNDYRYEMSDHFGDNGLLYDHDFKPVFKHEISLSVHPTATVDDIIKCIDGIKIYSGQSASMLGRFENKDGGGKRYEDVSLTSSLYSRYDNSDPSFSLNYDAAYNSDHTFDDADDVFLEPRDANGAEVQGNGAVSGGNLTEWPSASTVDEARNSSESWTFTFYMEGIGEVTATTSRVTYYANDLDPEDEGIWWRWVRSYHSNGKYRDEYGDRYDLVKDSIQKSASPTLSGVMDALTGGRDSNTPGLLAKDKDGYADSGGHINIHFNLVSDDYNLSSFIIRVEVNNDDTEDDVLQKIRTALDENTILDFYTPSKYYDGSSHSTQRAKRNEIDVPIYGGICGFFVEAGPEAGEHINIAYESLSLLSLGLQDTNALTVDAASRAIDEVKKGLQIVSEQRATFGAYQNRLEHAQKINQNSEENTQSAESVIRDTDIAKTMVEYANQSILNQAGASILAQANQQPGFIMQLLQ